MMTLNPFRIFRRETKGLAYPDPALLALFGIEQSASGITMSARAALAVPAVGSAIRVISEAAAGLELVGKRRQGVSLRDAPGLPGLALIGGAANEWTSGFELVRDLVVDALTDDRGGLARVVRDGGGMPREIIRYQSGLWSIEYDQRTGEPTYRLGNDLQAAGDVIHVRAPFGRSPLSLYREAIAVAMVLEQHASALFSRGARPAGALMFPKGMGEKAVNSSRDAWKAAQGGVGNAGATPVLFDGAEFKPFAFASTDAQFLENRKFQILEVARAFRVPPSMLFELDRATWSNTEQMGVEFLRYCLEPWLKVVEAALTRALVPGSDRDAGACLMFERDDLSSVDLATRATTVNSLRASKTLTQNEGRAWLSLAPVEGGDVFENPNIQTDPAGGNDAPPAADDTGAGDGA